MRKNAYFILSIVMLSLMTVCCISQKPLEGTSWKLDSYVNSQGNMVGVLSDTKITATFKEGTVEGSGGCNAYSGRYQVNGNAITIDSIVTTYRYCEEIMGQEKDYLTALQSVKTYKIEGNKLEMINADGKVVLIFTAA